MESAPKSKEEELEENTRSTLELARDIFKTVTTPEYVGSTTPQTRYEECCKKFPYFAQHYPICLRMMACDLKYNEKALKAYLEKQRRQPYQGMAEFIERQADYAKQLYIEDTKANGRHVSMKVAAKIREQEHASLKKWADKIKKDESEAKNMFEEEQKKHLEQRRRELLDFVNQQSPALSKCEPAPTQAETLPLDEEQEAKAAKAAEVAPSIADLEVTDEELPEMWVALNKYYDELITSITAANERIHELEELYQEEPDVIEVPETWVAEVKSKQTPKKENPREEVEKLMKELGLEERADASKKAGKKVDKKVDKKADKQGKAQRAKRH